MKFLDERIIFQMEAIPNQDMILRYEVEIDQDLVFIGNVFLQKNHNISIDVTDIVKNYKDSNEPPYSISNEESYNAKNVIVMVYNKDGSLLDSATEKIYFIYRRPLYDSNVTTPILDNTQTGIGYMPMLQGWLGRTGYLIPTYPIVQSDVFTFDMLANYQNYPLIQTFTNIYKDGTRGTNLFSESFTGGSFMRYSKPLSSIISGYSDTYSGFISARVLLSSNDTTWRVGFPFETGTSYILEASKTISSSISKVTLDYSGVQYVIKGVEADGIMTFSQSIKTDRNTNPTNITNQITINLLGGTTGTVKVASLVVRVNTTKQNEILDNGNFTLHFDIQQNILEGGNTSVKIRAEETVVRTYSICDLKHLNVTTFSPVNSGVRYDTIVANFDGQSRYFLKWEDRYGMPQCQPFAGTEKYSESIEKEEITNYLNKRKVINFTVQPKWSLNSKNISEKYMPFYESIFVSPYLHLYDAKQDKLYKVVLTNTEYLEKTFRNQGNQMFNIQLDVELDTTQNITY